MDFWGISEEQSVKKIFQTEQWDGFLYIYEEKKAQGGES